MAERAQSIIGACLLDLLARALTDGYLDVVAVADVGAFAFSRSGIEERAAPPFTRGYQSLLGESFQLARS